jgi:hypothetical protein
MRCMTGEASLNKERKRIINAADFKNGSELK